MPLRRPCLMGSHVAKQCRFQFSLRKSARPLGRVACFVIPVYGFPGFLFTHTGCPSPIFRMNRIFSPCLVSPKTTNQNRIPAISLPPSDSLGSQHKRRRLWLVYRCTPPPYTPQPTSPNTSITSQFCAHRNMHPSFTQPLLIVHTTEKLFHFPLTPPPRRCRLQP
jgi:hypothetical protein